MKYCDVVLALVDLITVILTFLSCSGWIFDAKLDKQKILNSLN